MRRAIPLLVLFAVAAVVLVIRPSLSNDTPSGCPAPFDIPADWVEWDEGGYSVWLPADFTISVRDGMDSQVAAWSGGDRSVLSDYGYYSSELTQESLGLPAPPLVCQSSSGDQAQVVVFGGSASYAVAGHWPDLGDAGIGMAMKLTLGGWSPDSTDLAMLRTIVGSVVFHHPAHPVPPRLPAEEVGREES